MNLFEALALLCLAGGLMVGFGYSLDAGVWAAVMGALRGAAIAFGGYFVFMLVLMTLLWIGLRYRPIFPPCKNGKCRDCDYSYLYLDTEPTNRHKWLQDRLEGRLVRCKCGTLYLDSLRDRRFYEVLDDGSLVPYLQYSPWGRWQTDVHAPPPDANPF